MLQKAVYSVIFWILVGCETKREPLPLTRDLTSAEDFGWSPAGTIDLLKLDSRVTVNWHQLLPYDRAFRSEGHGNEIVRIYFNETAKPYYAGEKQLPFAPGSIMVKAFVVADDRSSLDAHSFHYMQKHPPGYDPDGGDWEYAVAERQKDGRLQYTYRGPVTSCVVCHKLYEDPWDYALSVQRHRDFQGSWGAVKAWLGIGLN